MALSIWAWVLGLLFGMWLRRDVNRGCVRFRLDRVATGCYGFRDRQQQQKWEEFFHYSELPITAFPATA